MREKERKRKTCSFCFTYSFCCCLPGHKGRGEGFEPDRFFSSFFLFDRVAKIGRLKLLNLCSWKGLDYSREKNSQIKSVWLQNVKDWKTWKRCSNNLSHLQEYNLIRVFTTQLVRSMNLNLNFDFKF